MRAGVYACALRRFARLALTLICLMTMFHATAAEIPDSARAREAAARVQPALERQLAAKRLRYGAPVFLRIFKREAELELWLQGTDGKFVLFHTYPICKFSGDIGPKQREGDNQAPEGFYSVGPKQLNPMSQYHLAFNLGYPNAYDHAHGRTGSALMVHGNCVPIGCYAMGDAGIEEIYTLAAAALRAGQDAFDVHIFPFRPTAAALAANAVSPWHAFWQELAPAYAFFEWERMPPDVSVHDGRYRIAGRGASR